MAKDQIGLRVRALREALGLSQQALAERGGLSRTEITKVEGGHNQASTFAMRASLARGFGASLETIVALLDGDAPIAALVPRCSPTPPAEADGAEQGAA